MPTFGTCANHGKTWYLLWWSLQMEDQAARSFTSSIITFSSFLSNPFKKVVCFFFFSRHPWNHTNCQGCSHRGRQSHNSGWRDRPTPGSRYKWIMLWHNDMLLHQHASNLEIKKLKWIFVDSSPPPRRGHSSFFQKFYQRSLQLFRLEGKKQYQHLHCHDPQIHQAFRRQLSLLSCKCCGILRPNDCQFGQGCYDVAVFYVSCWCGPHICLG